MVCGHSSRDHYAKGLCSSCYMKEGRMKKFEIDETLKLGISLQSSFGAVLQRIRAREHFFGIFCPSFP